MQERGLEPLHLSVQAPKTCASANSATPAPPPSLPIVRPSPASSRSPQTPNPTPQCLPPPVLRRYSGGGPRWVSLAESWPYRNKGKIGEYMTLDYKSPDARSTSNHDHIYTTLLGVLGFFLIIGMITLYSIRQRPGATTESKTALGNVLLIDGCFLAAIMLVLLIRIVSPANRRWPTLGLNIILVLFVPIGTALAIYGFWKVDKNLRNS